MLCALDHRLFEGYLPAFHDFSLHARLLVALPALLVGKLVTDHLLTRAVNYLLEAGTVTDAKRTAFEALLRRTARFRDSWVAMLGLVALAFALSAIEVTQYRAYEGSWRVQANGSLSAAGYWYSPGRATAVFQPPFGVDLDLRALDRVAREPGAPPAPALAFHADGAAAGWSCCSRCTAPSSSSRSRSERTSAERSRTAWCT